MTNLLPHMPGLWDASFGFHGPNSMHRVHIRAHQHWHCCRDTPHTQLWLHMEHSGMKHPQQETRLQLLGVDDSYYRAPSRKENPKGICDLLKYYNILHESLEEGSCFISWWTSVISVQHSRTSTSQLLPTPDLFPVSRSVAVFPTDE